MQPRIDAAPAPPPHGFAPCSPRPEAAPDAGGEVAASGPPLPRRRGTAGGGRRGGWWRLGLAAGLGYLGLGGGVLCLRARHRGRHPAVPPPPPLLGAAAAALPLGPSGSAALHGSTEATAAFAAALRYAVAGPDEAGGIKAVLSSDPLACEHGAAAELLPGAQQVALLVSASGSRLAQQFGRHGDEAESGVLRGIGWTLDDACHTYDEWAVEGWANITSEAAGLRLELQLWESPGGGPARLLGTAAAARCGSLGAVSPLFSERLDAAQRPVCAGHRRGPHGEHEGRRQDAGSATAGNGGAAAANRTAAAGR